MLAHPLNRPIGGWPGPLTTRDVIGQAKGILMERFTITDHQAFLILATASAKTNLKLRDVAEQLTATGLLLGQS